MLEQRAPRFVYVLGEVGKPGQFTLTGPTTLMGAIAMAGGWTPGANLRQVVVFRRGEDWRLMATMLDIKGALYGRRPAPADEIWLNDSDIVVIPKTPIQATDEFIGQYFTRGLYACSRSSPSASSTSTTSAKWHSTDAPRLVARQDHRRQYSHHECHAVRFRHGYRRVRELAAHRHQTTRVKVDRDEWRIFGAVENSRGEEVRHATGYGVNVVRTWCPRSGSRRPPLKDDHHGMAFLGGIDGCKPTGKTEINSRRTRQTRVRIHELIVHTNGIEEHFRLSNSRCC